MLLLAILAGTGCIAVEGDRILARDLAAAVPAFAKVAPDEIIGFAPQPGARRIFAVSELERTARRYGPIETPVARGACVERAAEILPVERVVEALRKSLPPQAKIEVLDYSRYSVPRGELEFPTSGVGRPVAAGGRVPAVVWRGRVRYAGGRSATVWARVRASLSLERMLAVEDLPAGRPIADGQVKMETAEVFPLLETSPTLEQVIGRAPRRTIRAGMPVPAFLLEAPDDIRRGDTVSVTVSSGTAQLTLEAKAETGGKAGDAIVLKNPESGKRFSARVEGRGKATIDATKTDAGSGFDSGAGGGR